MLKMAKNLPILVQDILTQVADNKCVWSVC